MQVKVLIAKIRNAVITDANPEYRGSITIDQDIMDSLGILPWQVVDVNLKGRNAQGIAFRGTTYVIPGEKGTGCVKANGALSYHISKGDTVHINVYGYMDYKEAIDHCPKILETNINFHHGNI